MQKLPKPMGSLAHVQMHAPGLNRGWSWLTSYGRVQPRLAFEIRLHHDPNLRKPGRYFESVCFQPDHKRKQGGHLDVFKSISVTLIQFFHCYNTEHEHVDLEYQRSH